jgi:hypothetical protein
MPNKYTPLEHYLRDLPESQREVSLRFEEIERILNSRRLMSPNARWRHDAASGSKPPASAYEDQRWWDHETEGARPTRLVSHPPRPLRPMGAPPPNPDGFGGGKVGVGEGWGGAGEVSTKSCLAHTEAPLKQCKEPENFARNLRRLRVNSGHIYAGISWE